MDTPVSPTGKALIPSWLLWAALALFALLQLADKVLPAALGATSPTVLGLDAALVEIKGWLPWIALASPGLRLPDWMTSMLTGRAQVIGKPLALLLCLGLLLAPHRAHAAPTLHLGPSVSLYELRLDGQVGQLAPGLGVQGWAQWSQVSVGAAVFGSALGLGTAHVGAALSVAPFACVTQWGLCLGPGLDLSGSQGGLFEGFTWRSNFFLVASVQPAFFELLHFGTK